jgi:hypothetical protein
LVSVKMLKVVTAADDINTGISKACFTTEIEFGVVIIVIYFVQQLLLWEDTKQSWKVAR